jgi:hypothetical protein
MTPFRIGDLGLSAVHPVDRCWPDIGITQVRRVVLQVLNAAMPGKCFRGALRDTELTRKTRAPDESAHRSLLPCWRAIPLAATKRAIISPAHLSAPPRMVPEAVAYTRLLRHGCYLARAR